jgi:hypothetical protein
LQCLNLNQKKNMKHITYDFTKSLIIMLSRPIYLIALSQARRFLQMRILINIPTCFTEGYNWSSGQRRCPKIPGSYDTLELDKVWIYSNELSGWPCLFLILIIDICRLMAVMELLYQLCYNWSLNYYFRKII